MKNPKRRKKRKIMVEQSWADRLPEILLILLVLSFVLAAIGGAVFDWHDKHHHRSTSKHHHQHHNHHHDQVHFDPYNDTHAKESEDHPRKKRTAWEWLFGKDYSSHYDHHGSHKHKRKKKHQHPENNVHARPGGHHYHKKNGDYHPDYKTGRAHHAPP